MYHTSMMELASEAAERGIGFSAIYTAGDSLITRARNRLVNRFLEQPRWSHLLFIDADIGFSSDQAFRLLASGHNVVGGVYPLKAMFWDRIAPGELSAADRQARSVEYVVGVGDTPREDAHGFLAVDYVGTGFLLIARATLERLCERFPETRYFTDDAADKDFFQRGRPSTPRYALFDTRIDHKTGRYLSEDFAFCELCREAGEQVWADLTSRLDHVGLSTFLEISPLNLGAWVSHAPGKHMMDLLSLTYREANRTRLSAGNKFRVLWSHEWRRLLLRRGSLGARWPDRGLTAVLCPGFFRHPEAADRLLRGTATGHCVTWASVDRLLHVQRYQSIGLPARLSIHLRLIGRGPRRQSHRRREGR
jgi:hypothetical protein